MIRTTLKRVETTIDVEITEKDVWDWVSRCNDLEMLTRMDKHIKSQVRALKYPDDDDFRSRA